MNTGMSFLQPYPFTKLQALIKGVTPAALSPIHLSIGEPQHPSPAFVLEVLHREAQSYAKYPTTQGSDSLRETIRQWLVRRFQLSDKNLTAEHVLPVSGTREALFSFAQCILNAKEPSQVLMPNPFYQIYEGAALLAGSQPLFVNATKESGYKANFLELEDEQFKNCRLLYLCSPHNPTGATYTLDEYRRLITLAIKYNFIIASDECYSEIYYDENQPPAGLLEAAESMGLDQYQNCICFHSLSKRSNLPGLRSGFVAGDRNIIQTYLKYRTYHGAAMPVPVQEASKAAWLDETHVIENRRLYRKKFDLAKEILANRLPCSTPKGAFYLWPELQTEGESFAKALYASQNVLVLPGSFLSRPHQGKDPGKNHVRIALVADLDTCKEALERIAAFIDS
jgi:N-succinyldiaminopimelate aminotransferase